MSDTNIIQDQEYKEGMLNGMSIIAKVIRPTYGGSGTNKIVESKLNPGHLVTNDAQTIIQALKFKGIIEKRVLALIQEMVAKTDKESGNARKTTILIAEKILAEGFAYEGDKNQLKKDLDKLIPFIESEIDKLTIPISVDEVESVATTASENEDTGKLLQEIYQKIGKDGIIIPEASGTYETSYKFIDGVRFDMTGFLSPYMVHDEQAVKDKVKETKAVYENPLILVTKKKITTDEDINPLLTQMERDGKKDLVIFTQDMDSGVASMLINLHKSRRFNILIIKNSSVWKDYVFEDFAKCVGATIVEDATGFSSFKNLPASILGTCGQIIVDANETVITGTKDISDHIAALESQGDEDSKLRLSWLKNKTAILKLGANSETDLSLKRLKCYDAIRSSELALKYGVVKGGGICLAEIADILDKPNLLFKADSFTAEYAKKVNDSITNGYPVLIPNPKSITPIEIPIANKIMAKALRDPRAQQILNSKTEEVPDNIVDASQTQKFAVRNAIGIASTILTADGDIYIPELTPQEMAYQVATQQNHAFS